MTGPHTLSCHCGAVRIEVDAQLSGVIECNCSTCRRTGFMHWKVPGHAVRLVTERCHMSTYTWRAITEGQHFCATCGTPLLRTGYADGSVSVNARCVDGLDVFELEVRRFDGRTQMPPGPLP